MRYYIFLFGFCSFPVLIVVGHVIRRLEEFAQQRATLSLSMMKVSFLLLFLPFITASVFTFFFFSQRVK